MTLENILSDVNYNIEKIVEELRKRIMSISEIDEIIDKHQIIYNYYGEDFCVIKIKKDNLEIDFKADKMLEDPIDFSWKIRYNKKSKFDRRMHIKNIFDIDITCNLILQSYECVHSKRNYNKKLQ
jgi:hypothetical protein